MTSVLTSPIETSDATWLDLIRAEYQESPGLSLTLPQASRFWSLDPARCSALFAALVEVGFLRPTTRGTFVRVVPQ